MNSNFWTKCRNFGHCGVSKEVIIFEAVHFLLLARLIIKSMLYYNSTNDPRKGETKHKKAILGVNNGCAFTEK